mmetsp:Transcript_15237/g.39249  ORF Transcript_15237/g.39249 Transcript_15237/m.39249 type:complete len:207 (+) Transcript_15237:93-713(+)
MNPLFASPICNPAPQPTSQSSASMLAISLIVVTLPNCKGHHVIHGDGRLKKLRVVLDRKGCCDDGVEALPLASLIEVFLVSKDGARRVVLPVLRPQHRLPAFLLDEALRVEQLQRKAVGAVELLLECDGRVGHSDVEELAVFHGGYKVLSHLLEHVFSGLATPERVHQHLLRLQRLGVSVRQKGVHVAGPAMCQQQPYIPPGCTSR